MDEKICSGGQCADYRDACKCVAEMHGAAMGQYGAAPVRGVVQDVRDLKYRHDQMRLLLEGLRDRLRAGSSVKPVVALEIEDVLGIAGVSEVQPEGKP